MWGRIKKYRLQIDCMEGDIVMAPIKAKMTKKSVKMVLVTKNIENNRSHGF